jgi:hypothetical protein
MNRKDWLRGDCSQAIYRQFGLDPLIHHRLQPRLSRLITAKVRLEIAAAVSPPMMSPSRQARARSSHDHSDTNHNLFPCPFHCTFLIHCGVCSFIRGIPRLPLPSPGVKAAEMLQGKMQQPEDAVG